MKLAREIILLLIVSLLTFAVWAWLGIFAGMMVTVAAFYFGRMFELSRLERQR